MRSVLCVVAVLMAAPASAQEREPATHMLVELGWRYPLLGQELVPGEDDFPITYHVALSLYHGTKIGFFSGLRFDGLGPRGGTYPFAATARVGYYFDVHEYVPPRTLSWTDSQTGCETDGMWRTCTTTTTRHTSTRPAHFVKGLRSVYAGYRHLGFVEGDEDASGERRVTQAGAAVLGIGFHGTKITLSGIPYMTFTSEVEGWYHLYGWDDDERIRWGGQVRLAVLLGPAFVDVTLALDAGFGSELSLGVGMLLHPVHPRD